MSGGGREQKGFMAYDYKEVTAEGNRISFLLDGYENFGWEPDERQAESARAGNVLPHPSRTVLRLRRDRKIVNKVELTRLERNFEAYVNEIDKLERKKTSAATMWALVTAIIGTAFMAGSVFAVTAQPPHYILCIILAIPGFLGWILPYFLYKKIAEQQTERITPLIEEKYDEIYELCEKGHKLLY